MIRAGEGYSAAPEGVEAVQEATTEALEQARTESPELVFLFATGHHGPDSEQMLAAAVARLGTEAVVGCTGFGVLAGAIENDREPGVSVLALSADGPAFVPFLERGEDAALRIGERILPHVTEMSSLILLPGLSYDPTELIADIETVAGEIPVLGAASAGGPLDRTSWQWCGSSVVTDGVAGVLISGLSVRTGVAQGCQPFGQAYTITRAEGNVIQELAFSPAVDALKEALDTLAPEEKESVGRNVFLGLAMDEMALSRDRGDFLIRNLMGLDPSTGSIAVSEPVSVGQTVQFNRRTPDAAHEDIHMIMGRLDPVDPDRAFGLYFNCMGRGFGLYGCPDHDVTAIRRHLGVFPLVGFFGNSEFAPVGGRNFVHSYTGALALFDEP